MHKSLQRDLNSYGSLYTNKGGYLWGRGPSKTKPIFIDDKQIKLIDYLSNNATFKGKERSRKNRRGGKSTKAFVPEEGTVDLAVVFHKKPSPTTSKKRKESSNETSTSSSDTPCAKKSSKEIIPFKMPRKLKLVIMNPVVMEPHTC